MFCHFPLSATSHGRFAAGREDLLRSYCAMPVTVFMGHEGMSSWYPIGYESGWIPEPVRNTCSREYSRVYLDSNSDPSVVHPVASRYTD
jgi:hypothetical protein